MAEQRPKFILWLTIVAAPIAFGFETVLRKILFPPEFEEVRELLRPMLTPLAWVLGGAAALAVWVGLMLQRHLTKRRMQRSKRRDDPTVRYRDVLGVFMITASVPQLPAIFSTFTYMFGASSVPVLVGVGLSSLGVIAQALRVGWLADEFAPERAP